MEWTQILAAAGIEEPPGYSDTLVLVAQRKIAQADAEAQELKEKQTEQQEKLAAAAHRSTRRGRRR
jgi:hypothetical protein